MYSRAEPRLNCEPGLGCHGLHTMILTCRVSWACAIFATDGEFFYAGDNRRVVARLRSVSDRSNELKLGSLKRDGC